MGTISVKSLMEMCAANGHTVERNAVYGFLSFLEQVGMIAPVGTLRDPGVKGRGQTVWHFDDTMTTRMNGLISQMAGAPSLMMSPSFHSAASTAAPPVSTT